MTSSPATGRSNGPRGAYARSAQTRERILAATLRVAGEHGLKATTVARIAEAAGVGQGNLYYHFPSRDDLLEQAASWVFQQLLLDIAAAVEGVEGTFERDEASFRAWVAFVQRHPGYVRLAEERRFHFPEQYDAGVGILLDWFRTELAEGVARGEVRPLAPDEIEQLAHHMLGARYYMDLLLQQQRGPASGEALVAHYRAFVRGALAPPGS